MKRPKRRDWLNLGRIDTTTNWAKRRTLIGMSGVTVYPTGNPPYYVAQALPQ